MTIFRPELHNLGLKPDLNLRATHPNHLNVHPDSFLSAGKNIIETGNKIGANNATGSVTFENAMLNALDKVSSYQQFASELNQAALADPDSVDVHDITIAQAKASMALNITRSVLNRVVQSWRDLINVR